MSPRNRLNLLLLAVIGILVLFVIYEPGVEKQPEKILGSLDKNSIRKISIKRLATKDVVLVKKDNQWVMQAPYSLPANDFKVESLLDLPGSNYEASYVLEGLDLKKYGLDKPRASITFNDKLTYEFGGTESLKNRRYIRNNNTLYLANDVFYHRLSLNETDYLDHSLLPGNHTIDKLVLPSFSMQLEDGKWKITPAPQDYSNDQANELIESWKLSQAITISPLEKKPGTQKIEIYTDANSQPVIFHVVKTDDALFLLRPDIGLQFELGIDKAKELLELPPKVEASLPDDNAAASSD
jgi:hypothetical protein